MPGIDTSIQRSKAETTSFNSLRLFRDKILLNYASYLIVKISSECSEQKKYVIRKVWSPGQIYYLIFKALVSC